MPWAVAGAAVAAGGSMLASSQQADAVKGSSGAAIRAQQEQYQSNQALLAPWITHGTDALSWLTDLSGINGADGANGRVQAGFMQDPGRQFQLDQGLKAIDAGAAGRGLLHSGATIKAEQQYGNDLANQSFSTWYNRLAGLAQGGLNASSALAGIGQQTGAGIAQTDASAGNALASIYGSQGKGISDAVNKLGSNLAYGAENGTGAGGYLNKLFGSGTTANGWSVDKPNALAMTKPDPLPASY